MYTGLLDVLHDAADVDLLTVRDRVHVDLGVVLHKLVDEGRVSWPCAGAGREVEVQVIVVVDDLHPAPAEHVRRPHDDRMPELARHLPRLLGRRCSPEPGVRDAELCQEPRIRTPATSSSCASFRGLWPPNCRITPSGSSRLMTSSTCSAVSGSK